MTDDGLLLVDTDRFHGPLDLLLHLIRTQDIDIFDIPIARITGQFLAAIEDLGDGDVDEAGDFLRMAATLVGIKARMLMPRPRDEDEHDPRAELVRRLLEYVTQLEGVSFWTGSGILDWYNGQVTGR